MTTMQQTDKSDYSLLRTQPRFTGKVCKPLDKLALSSEFVTSKQRGFGFFWPVRP